MTNQQQALRTAAIFLKLQSMGQQFSKAESKMMSDMCFLALPMAHRLSKEDLAHMKRVVVIRNKS